MLTLRMKIHIKKPVSLFTGTFLHPEKFILLPCMEFSRYKLSHIHTLYGRMLWHYLVPTQCIYHTFHQLYRTAADLLMPMRGDTAVTLQQLVIYVVKSILVNY